MPFQALLSTDGEVHFITFPTVFVLLYCDWALLHFSEQINFPLMGACRALSLLSVQFHFTYSVLAEADAWQDAVQELSALECA